MVVFVSLCVTETCGGCFDSLCVTETCGGCVCQSLCDRDMLWLCLSVVV